MPLLTEVNTSVGITKYVLVGTRMYISKRGCRYLPVELMIRYVNFDKTELPGDLWFGSW